MLNTPICSCRPSYSNTPLISLILNYAPFTSVNMSHLTLTALTLPCMPHTWHNFSAIHPLWQCFLTWHIFNLIKIPQNRTKKKVKTYINVIKYNDCLVSIYIHWHLHWLTCMLSRHTIGNRRSSKHKIQRDTSTLSLVLWLSSSCCSIFGQQWPRGFQWYCIRKLLKNPNTKLHN